MPPPAAAAPKVQEKQIQHEKQEKSAGAKIN
jgi:hypothetical protein